MIRVFHDHQLIAEYPADHVASLDGEALVVANAAGRRVKRFPAGAWHGAGEGLLCASVDLREDCATCRPGGEPNGE